MDRAEWKRDLLPLSSYLFTAPACCLSLPLVFLDTLNYKAAAGERLERSQTVERFGLLEREYLLRPDYLK